MTLFKFQQRNKVGIKTKATQLFSLLFAVAMVLTIVLNACSAKQDVTIKVGMNRWPGFDVALYAQEAGLFEKRGLKVELVLFDVAQDAVRAMLQGDLDMTFASLWELMQADPGNDAPAYVMVTNISAGSDGIVAQPGIQSIKDLRGKKVGAKLGTVSHLILLEALNLHQMQPEDVQVEDVPNEIAEAELSAGRLAAAVLWEPSLSFAAKATKGKIVFTTKEVDSLVLDGLACQSAFLTSQQDTLQQFLLAWFDLMHAIETNPNEVFEVVGEKLGQSSESFAKDYAGLKKGDIELNRRMFKPQGRLQEVSEQIAQLLRNDPRHSRVIREDIEINAEPVMGAISTWKP